MLRTTSLQVLAKMGGARQMDARSKSLLFIGPVEYKNFHFKLKGGFMITLAEYKDFI